MSTTFSTPLRVFKRNNPTNNGASTPSNVGAVVVSQQATLVPGVPTVITIPAGSFIQSISTVGTTAGGALTLSAVSYAPTPVTTPLGTVPTALGVNPAALATTSAAAAVINNVGLYDVAITATADSAALGSLNVVYTARNVDGTITGTGENLVNQ
jgi:hypothetical protein